MKIIPALLLTLQFSSPANAEMHTPEFYPKKPATDEQIEQLCNRDDNPEQKDSLIAFTQGEEYPFEVMHCQTKRIGLYNCQTIEGLVFFEFEIKDLFRRSGNPLPDNAGQVFSNLVPAYDEHCQELIF